MAMKLIYFGAPARAAAPRLMLSVAQKTFQDVIVTREQWPSLKPTMPGGQLPVLELANGEKLAQVGAILWICST